MINNVIIAGRLVRNAELKITTSGLSIANFTVATSRYNKDKEDTTDFINCVAFGKTAELVAERIEKGGRVLVQGSIKTGSYETKEGRRVYTTDVTANRVQIIDWAGETKKQEIGFDEMTPTDNDSIPFQEGDINGHEKTS